jgi:hypothetical protein
MGGAHRAEKTVVPVPKASGEPHCAKKQGAPRGHSLQPWMPRLAVIDDELHYAKNTSSKGSDGCVALKAPKTIGLTSTMTDSLGPRRPG